MLEKNEDTWQPAQPVPSTSPDGGVDAGALSDDIESVSDNKSAYKIARDKEVGDGSLNIRERISDEFESVSNLKTSNDSTVESVCGQKRNISTVLLDSDSTEIEDSEQRQKRVCERQLNSDDTRIKSADFIEVFIPDNSDSESEELSDRGPSQHTCWIVDSSDFQAIQTEKIRAKHDGAELLCLMNVHSLNLDGYDKACYHRWWLSMALQYDHIELLNLMFAEKKHSDFNSKDKCHFVHPLYVAIENGNLSQVQILLRAGASVTHEGFDGFRYSTKHICYDTRLYNYKRLSAVEYACFVNQPEVLKVLVTHFYRELSQRADADNHFTENLRLIHPLHVVIKLASEIHIPHGDQLPSFIQLIIDAGGDVNCIDNFGFTPLYFLMRNIQPKTLDVVTLDHIDSEYRRTIVEVTKVLLNSGAEANTVLTEHGGESPLKCLVPIIYAYNYNNVWYEGATYLAGACALRNNLQLVIELARLLILNGAYRNSLMPSSFYLQFPFVVEQLLDYRKLSIAYGEDCTPVIDEIMDSLGDLLRWGLFAGVNHFTSGILTTFGNRWHCQNWFIEIADYSSQTGRSDKLINMMLNVLNANTTRELMDILLSQGTDILTHSNSQISSEQMNNMIRCVENVDCPQSLEYLACRAINRAMSVRALLCDSCADLGLPTELKRLVLFE